MTTPEGVEKQDIDKFLKKLGPERCWSFKPYMAGMGKSGVPDYCLCLNGCFWGIEVKRSGKKATVIQNRRMNEIERAGGHAVAGTADVVIQVLTDWLAARGIRV